MNESFEIKAYSRTELAQLYGVSKKTLSSWILSISKDWPVNKKIYTPKQVEAIVNHLGEPKSNYQNHEPTTD